MKADSAHSLKQCKPFKNVILPSTTSYIISHKQIITSHIFWSLKYKLQDHHLKHYIREQTGWFIQQFNEVKLEYIRHVFSRGTTNQKKTYIRIMHKLLVTDKHTFKILNHTNHWCKRCNHFHEDLNHIFQC